jgi:hypothetical protein
MKRFFHLVLWFMLGTLVGLPIGWYWTNRNLVRNADALGHMAEEATVDYFAKAQYRNADGESARQALLAAIQVHNQLKGSRLHGKAEQIDLGYCYGELSLLEEGAGNLDLSRDYMQRAEQTLRDAGFKEANASEQSIRERLGKEPFAHASLKHP